jgi:hypothetical protein
MLYREIIVVCSQIHSKHIKTLCAKNACGTKRDEVTRKWRKLQQVELNVTYSSTNIVRVTKSRKIRCAGHAARMGGRGEVYTGFWWGNLRERQHLEDPRIIGRTILRWIFRKQDVGVLTGSIWLRIGTAGRHLSMR